MNVYDFDGTIYNGDCTVDFWLFCLRRYPAILRMCPNLFLHGIRYMIFEKDIKKFKSNFFRFLSEIPNVKDEVVEFWNFHEKKIYKWYLSQKRGDDIIISASPQFLLNDLCTRIDVSLIATIIDEKTGNLLGENCKGEEKVRRFQRQYPHAVIENFYSDSYTDEPMAAQAKQSFFVRNGKISPWKNRE